jgi:hypothetical protein
MAGDCAQPMPDVSMEGNWIVIPTDPIKESKQIALEGVQWGFVRFFLARLAKRGIMS